MALSTQEITIIALVAIVGLIALVGIIGVRTTLQDDSQNQMGFVTNMNSAHESNALGNAGKADIVDGIATNTNQAGRP